ncbi:hypothetical protein AMELA_G00291430, partial [Ameiurus melas]
MPQSGLDRTNRLIILVWAVVLVAGVTLFFLLFNAPLPDKEHNTSSCNGTSPVHIIYSKLPSRPKRDIDVAQLMKDRVKDQVLSPYRPFEDISRRTLDRMVHMLKTHLTRNGTDTNIVLETNRLVEEYFLSRPTSVPATALPIPWTYQNDLISLSSRRMFCALALVTLAYSEALLRSSPHLASVSVDQASMNLTVGRFRLVGRAADSWCRFNVSTALPHLLPVPSYKLSFQCSAEGCVNLKSKATLSTHRPQKPHFLSSAHAAAFMKLQHYSLLTDNQTLDFDHTNLYLSWMFHTARSVTDKSCLVCHDRRSAPHLMFPLGNTTECLSSPYTEEFLCPTICLLGSMSATLGPDWMHNVSSSCLYQPMHTDDSAFVKVRDELPDRMPFCLCSDLGVYPVGNLSYRCDVVVSTDDLYIPTLSSVGTTSTTVSIPIPDLAYGTLGLADIFWYCGMGTARQTLPPEWHGCCAPVRLDGKTRVITLPDEDAPRRRERRDTSLWRQYLLDVDTMNYTDWAEHAEVTLNWLGVPVGVPDRFKAMGKVGSGLAAILLPGVQVARNTAWINYIWYNQQRFLNHTLSALGLMKSQLHATSIMAAQNRFTLDQMRAPDDGVCTMIGPECCAAIPLHTGARGALNKVLDRLQALQKEHVANTGAGDLFTLPGWMGWFFSGSWMASLSRLGLALGVLFIFVLLLFCCIIPCTRKLAITAVTTTNVSGQYVVMGEALPPQRGVVF